MLEEQFEILRTYIRGIVSLEDRHSATDALDIIEESISCGVSHENFMKYIETKFPGTLKEGRKHLREISNCKKTDKI